MARAQVSVEYMLVSGIVVATVVVIMFMIWQGGILEPKADKGKVGFSEIDVVDWVFYVEPNISVGLKLVNTGADDMQITKVELLLDKVSCSDNITSFLSSGDSETRVLNCSSALVGRFSVGDMYNGDLVISYSNIRTGSISISGGSLWGGAQLILPMLLNLMRNRS